MFKTNIPGYITDQECVILGNLTKFYNSSTCIGVEIGSLFGRSSSIIAQSIPLGRLYCIDLWEDHCGVDPNLPEEIIALHNYPRKDMLVNLSSFLEYVKDYNNIVAIKGSSPKCVNDWKEPIDFLFLDASHSNPDDRINLQFWLPKIKKGGMVIGHDYSPQFPDVIENVMSLRKILDKLPVITETIWSFVI